MSVRISKSCQFWRSCQCRQPARARKLPGGAFFTYLLTSDPGSSYSRNNSWL